MQIQEKLPVLKVILLSLLAVVHLVFLVTSLPTIGFIVTMILLLLLWGFTFYMEGIYELADIPILFLILGTFSYGKAFSLLGIQVGSLPLYVTEIILAVSLGFLLLKGKKLQRQWFMPLPIGLAPVMLFYFLLGTLYLLISVKVNGAAALRDIVFCHYLPFLLITLSLLEKPLKINKFLPALFPAVIFLLFTGFVLFFIYIPGSTFKEFLRELKMTNLGLYSGLIVIFGMSFYTFVKKKIKPVLGLFIYLGFLFVIIAEVRASWAGMLVSLILLAILLKKEFKIFILIAILTVVSVFIIDYFDLGVQKNKLASLKEQVHSLTRRTIPTMPVANIKWRLDIWQQTLEEIKEYPVFGWGFGTQIDYDIWWKKLSWLKAIGASPGIVPPHNHVLAITYKMGLLGLLLFLFINLRIFFYGLRYLKRCKSGFNKRFLIASLAGLVYWHGMAFFFDILESPPTGIFLWILLGAILGVVYIDHNLKNNHEGHEGHEELKKV